MLMKNNKILILYLDKNGEYSVESFREDEKQKAKEIINKINSSRNEKLLWLVCGNLLSVTPEGEIYG